MFKTNISRADDIIFRKFKAFYDEVISIDMNSSTEYHIDAKVLKQQKILLQKINIYLESYDWLKQQRVKERVSFFLQNNFSYKLLALKELNDGTESVELTKEEYSKILDAKYKAVKESISYAAERFLNKIGNSTLELIYEGNYQEARLNFQTSSGQIGLQDIFLESIIAKLPKGKDGNIDMQDCISELRFLEEHTNKVIDNRLVTLNVNKLAQIQYMLITDKKKYAKLKTNLHKYFNSKITLEQFEERFYT